MTRKRGQGRHLSGSETPKVKETGSAQLAGVGGSGIGVGGARRASGRGSKVETPQGADKSAIDVAETGGWLG